MERIFRFWHIPLTILLFASLLATGCATTDDKATREVNAALELGGLYFAENDIGKAIETYDRGLEVQPENEKLLYNKIAALLKANRFDEAVKLAETSYGSHPKLLRFAKAQATGLELAGKPDEAILVWEEIVSLDPADMESRVRLMQLLIKAQRYDTAAVHARFLLERKSADKAALEALSTIDRAAGGTGEPWASLAEAGFPAPTQN